MSSPSRDATETLSPLESLRAHARGRILESVARRALWAPVDVGSIPVVLRAPDW